MRTHDELFLETLQQLTKELRDLRSDIFDLRCEFRAEKIYQELKDSCGNLNAVTYERS